MHKPGGELRSAQMAGNVEYGAKLPGTDAGADILLTLSRLLCDRSASLNLRFEEIAERAGVSLNTVENIANRRGNPTLQVLVRILNALNLRIEIADAAGETRFNRKESRDRAVGRQPMRKRRCMGRL